MFDASCIQAESYRTCCPASYQWHARVPVSVCHDEFIETSLVAGLGIITLSSRNSILMQRTMTVAKSPFRSLTPCRGEEIAQACANA